MKIKNIKSILIANRGEIAVRIAKTCRALGIQVYGLKSKLDPKPLVQKFCDDVFLLEGQTLSETYLNCDQILNIVKKNKISAVHPGYGFLSENESFAQSLKEQNIIFIGPKPEVIAAMGSKAKARELMQKASVPVVPGYNQDDQSENTLIAEAIKIGFPLLVKASAGGGGKGMRLVYKKEELKPAIQSAKSESLKSFGNDKLILEKYIENPRHIEFQIFGDSLGNLVHLGERECSIQRRYQKIIEETPSHALNDNLREKMAKAALNCAKILNYENAGTVEFILDPSGEFYFLEVNTRLQVEHPITEKVTNLDLVEWQIRVADGQSLPLKQNEILFSGHALECRIYAEDPANQFLPSIGKILDYDEPKNEYVRVDSGLEKNLEVSLNFDPMIAKVTTWCTDRDKAIDAMKEALKSYLILGVKTNQAFLLDILEHAAFLTSDTDTHFVAKHFSNWENLPSLDLKEFAAYFLQNSPQNDSRKKEDLHQNIWDHLKGFRVI